MEGMSIIAVKSSSGMRWGGDFMELINEAQNLEQKDIASADEWRCKKLFQILVRKVKR